MPILRGINSHQNYFPKNGQAQSPISPLQSLQNLEYNIKKETLRSIQLITVLSKKPFELEGRWSSFPAILTHKLTRFSWFDLGCFCVVFKRLELFPFPLIGTCGWLARPNTNTSSWADSSHEDHSLGWTAHYFRESFWRTLWNLHILSCLASFLWLLRITSFPANLM